MPKLKYKAHNFSDLSRAIIVDADRILRTYAEKGLVLTLRQLYYQFVSKDLIPQEWADKKTGSKNNFRAYKNLGEVVGKARLAGYIDWSMIEDRGRYLTGLRHYSDPAEAICRVCYEYRIDRWENQPYRPEIWIEKDALVGVIEGVCVKWDIPYFSCRGYTSLSEMWNAARRLQAHNENGQKPFVIHLGDHDPSGQDMSRDIVDRIRSVFRTSFAFERIALNMDQIEEYDPPPNPAKVTDSRYRDYVDAYGDDCWELDALEPEIFAQLIEKQVNEIVDAKQWKADESRWKKGKEILKGMANEAANPSPDLTPDLASLVKRLGRKLKTTDKLRAQAFEFLKENGLNA